MSVATKTGYLANWVFGNHWLSAITALVERLLEDAPEVAIPTHLPRSGPVLRVVSAAPRPARSARFRSEIEGLTEGEVRDAPEGLDPIWEELFPAEQARIVQLLVESINLGTSRLEVRLRVQGLAHMVRDLAGITQAPRRAA